MRPLNQIEMNTDPHPNPPPAYQGRGKKSRTAHVGWALPTFLLSAFLSQISFAADTWNLLDVRFASRPVVVTSIGADGIHTDSAALNWNDILEISRPLTAPQAQAKYDIYLTTGDRLMGEPIAMGDDKLQWQSPTLGQIDLPLSRVAAIARTGKPPADLDAVRKDDVVQLANGDTAHGIISQVNASGVTIQTGDATPTLGFDAVGAILFATPPGTGGAAHTSFRVRFADDTSITVASVALNADKLTLKFDEKITRDIDLSAVAAIEQLDGPVSWLTSRQPAENIYKPFFEENFPTRFDKTVDDGKPIPAKFPGFRHGIGCHSYAKLVYDLDGKYAAFRTQYAIDSDSPLADVTVRIKLDDKTIIERANVKGGHIYPVETVPLGTAKTLTLEVDYGENYATEDRFVWLDPALLRVLPSDATTEPSAK
jgi:hypothetical protein